MAEVDLHYGAARALRRVSVAAREGEATAILGRNGVGKSSLARAIVGQERISGGAIRWGETEFGRMRPSDRTRLGVAYVPQGREIFPQLTVRENLEVGFTLLPRGERKLPAEIFELFPVLAEMLKRRGGDLSGGQQQQLAIARALVTRPRLLILDEPTEGIQPSVIKDIGAAIRKLRGRGDMAILLIEQYFEFAWDLADAVFVLDRGEVALAGRKDALVAKKVSALVAL